MAVVSLTKDGTIYLNDTPTNIHDVGDAIHKRFGKATTVYLRADRQTPWAALAQVVAMLGRSGFHVNMVTQPE